MHHIAIISIRPSTAQPMPTYRTMYAYELRQPPAYTTPTATLTAAEAATTPMEELSFLRATTDTAHSAHHDRGPRLPSLYGDDEPGRRVVVNVGCVHSRDGGRHVDHAHHDHHVHGHGHGLGGIVYGDAERKSGLERRGKSSGYSDASFPLVVIVKLTLIIYAGVTTRHHGPLAHHRTHSKSCPDLNSVCVFFAVDDRQFSPFSLCSISSYSCVFPQALRRPLARHPNHSSPFLVLL